MQFIVISLHGVTMSSRMKRYRADLNYLGTCSPKTRQLLLKNANTELLRAIAEAAWTVLSGEVKLTPGQRKRLVKDESVLRQLATKQRSLTDKRKVLSTQRGGNVIGFLFNLLKNIF
jgi:hypothetical protein